MFSELADSISARGKVILAIWIVAVLILFPPAVKSFEEMGYGIDDMADPRSGSAEADRVLSTYFDDPAVDPERTPYIVISYDSATGYRQLQGDSDVDLPSYVQYLRSSLLKDTDWITKLDVTSGALNVVRTYGTEDSGAMLLSISYASSYSASDVMEDTGNLRDKVAEVTDSYLYELYEREAGFSVYVTGDAAVTYDMSVTSASAFIATAILAILVTLILTGLFFGSATSSFVVLSSISLSTIVTMAAVFGYCSLFGVFFVPGFLTFISVMAMSFCHSVYVVASYRRWIMSGMDRDKALTEAVKHTSGPIATTSMCILVCMLVLALVEDGAVGTFGLCMSTGAVVTMLVSLTVPASLIHVTRNELFWSAESDGRVRFRFMRRFYGDVDGFFRRASAAVVRFTSTRGTVVLAIAVLATAGGVYYLSENGSNDETPYDMSDSLATGESKTGLDVLKGYSDGGMLHPFTVVVGYDDPVAKITMDSSGNRLEWTSADAVSNLNRLSDSLRSSDPDNVVRITGVFVWNDLVAEAQAGGLTDYREIIQYIGDAVGSIDGSLTPLFEESIAKLRLKGNTSEKIVTTCGPYMDYSVNIALGTIGYEMLASKEVVVSHLAMKVYTAESPVCVRSVQTIDSMESVLDSFRHSDGIEGAWLGGAGVVYDETMDDMESGFIHAAVVVLVTLLVVLSLVTISVSVPFRAVVTTAMGAVFSLCVTDILMREIWGSLSLTVQVVMLAVCITLGIWFNMVQEQHIIWCRRHGMTWTQASSDLMVGLQPVIGMTSIILAVCFGSYCFSGIQMLSQLGFALALCVLIDAFAVRTLVSPAMWSKAGRNRRLRFPVLHPLRGVQVLLVDHEVADEPGRYDRYPSRDAAFADGGSEQVDEVVQVLVHVRQHPLGDVPHDLPLDVLDVFLEGFADDPVVHGHPQDDPDETRGHQHPGQGALVLHGGDGLQAGDHLGDDQSESKAHGEQGESHAGDPPGHQEVGADEGDHHDERPDQRERADPLLVDHLHPHQGCDHPSRDEAEEHLAGLVQRQAVGDHHEHGDELQQPDPAESDQEHPGQHADVVLRDPVGDDGVLGPLLHPYQQEYQHDAELGERQALPAEEVEGFAHHLGVRHHRRYGGEGEDQSRNVPDVVAGHLRELPVRHRTADQDGECAHGDQQLPVPVLQPEIVSHGGAEYGSQAERKGHDLVRVQPLAAGEDLPDEGERRGEKESGAYALDDPERDHHLDALAQAQPQGAAEEHGGPHEDGVPRTQPVDDGPGDYDRGDLGDDVSREEPPSQVGAGLRLKKVLRDAHVHPVETGYEHA